jgi:flagellar basal body-associated protein FliL
MDFKNTEEIIEKGKKRPIRTLFILIVLVILVAAYAYITGFFSEKAKQHAVPPKDSSRDMLPSKDMSHQRSSTNAPVTNQHTEGNQSPGSE